MSGGYFDYKQFRITDIAETIDGLIESNEGLEGHHFDADVIAKFREAVPILHRAFVFAHRIDWLVSGDDGPRSFLERLEEELLMMEGND